VAHGRAGYSLLYRLGLKPWELDATPHQLIEAAERLVPGRALELGCGTGREAVELARRGWDVTGLDYVARAVEEAGRRAAAAAVQVRFLVADVTALADLELGGPFDLVYDNKCFHGLPRDSRRGYAEGIARVCRPAACYLLFALPPHTLRRALGLPGGIAAPEVTELFRPWFQIVRSERGKTGLFSPSFYEMRRA
jgi:SAM-dependent methyltransferase